jgi:APA family basic amino acid/polyamine antiporter
MTAKRPDRASTEPQSQGPALKRTLGLGLLVFYAVGVMIGAGIYVLVGEVAGRAGAWTPLAFLLAGLAAAITAASFAELASRIPEAGGSATYVRLGFGSDGLGVAVGFAVVATGLLSAAAVLQGGVGYLQAILPGNTALLVIGLGAILGGFAVWGAAQSLTLAAVLTVTETAGLLLVVGVAALADPTNLPAIPGTGAPATPTVPPTVALGAMAGAVFLAFFAFVGFEDVVNMAEETRDPQRNIPRAIALAFLIVIAIYMAVAWAALRIVPTETLAESPRPLALVYERATGNDAWFIAGIGTAAALNGVLAQIVMSARVLMSLGRQQPRLAWFATTHPTLRTPVNATLVCSAVVILLALTVALSGLAAATSFVLLGVFVLVNLALVRIKLAAHAAPGELRLPIAVPAAGALVSLAVMAGSLF